MEVAMAHDTIETAGAPLTAPAPLPHTTPRAAAVAAAALLEACGGGSAGGGAEGPPPPAPPPPPPSAAAVDAARFLTQASFGPRSAAEVSALQAQGLQAWLAVQFAEPAASHLAYLASAVAIRGHGKPTEETCYEAIWQQWLRGKDVLRARMSWALGQIFVISNVASDLRPAAMASYTDMLNRNAFGNYRQLLGEVTRHAAMGHYLNMLESEKEDLAAGTHPNENYAREVLQLFSIGLLKLNQDGTPLRVNGQTVPTYDQAVVQGFAKAFTGWGAGAQDNTRPSQFHNYGVNVEANWTTPMQPWTMFHDVGPKTLLNGRLLPAGQSAEQDLDQALDCIFQHPNVAPFIGRQLIQRLVTSNPSPAYVQRVATVFNNNGAGVRGDLKAVVSAILLDAEARSAHPRGQAGFGKLREPVLRFAHLLRALGAHSADGLNSIHFLDSSDNGLGQSPLLSPSVFNFYAPSFRPAGPLAQAGLAAPEFQITSETTAVASMNFFAALFTDQAYGAGTSRLLLDFAPLLAKLDNSVDALVAELETLFFSNQMTATTRARLTTLLQAMATQDAPSRLRAALTLVAMSTDFVVQQ